MKPTFKVLIVANGAPWATWPQKISWLENYFQPIATLQIDLKETSFSSPPMQSFTASGTQYEVLNGMVADIAPSWYAANVTPLAKGYDICLFVVPESQWPLMNCIRGTTTLGLSGPIPCQIASDENEAIYLNGIELFPTAQHYAAHELAHALFQLAGISFASDTTHYWDFAEKNLDGVLNDIKFKPMTPIPTPSNPDVMLPWSTPSIAADNRHNIRVLCDLAGLAVYDKNVITACIEVESSFYNYLPNGEPVEHKNFNPNNSLSSTDWGICQINDYFHIGAGKDFPSVAYVLANPEAVVSWMITQYKAGKITMWSSYTSGAYKKFMPK